MGQYAPGQIFQLVSDAATENKAVGCIESELDRRCQLVYVLPTWAGRLDEVHADQAWIDRDIGCYADHSSIILSALLGGLVGELIGLLHK